MESKKSYREQESDLIHSQKDRRELIKIIIDTRKQRDTYSKDLKNLAKDFFQYKESIIKKQKILRSHTKELKEVISKL